MSSRKRARKAQQQRLTFEPVAATPGSSSSPLREFGRSPAKVRFSSPGKTQASSPSRSQTASPFSAIMVKGRRKPRQQTLESSLGKGEAKKSTRMQKQVPQEKDDDHSDVLPSSSVARNTVAEARRRAAMSPPRSSMFGSQNGRRRRVVDSDSETPVEEDGGVTDSDGEGPLKHETPRQDRHKALPLPAPLVTISSDDEDNQDNSDDEESENDVQTHARSSQSLPNQAAPDEDEDDDLPMRTPRSSMPRQRGQRIIDVDEDEDEDEDVQTPAKRRRLTRHKASPATSDSDSETSDAESPPAKSKHRGTGKGKGKATYNKRNSSPPASAARSMRSGARKHRSQREKRMELLRRHRAGEKDLTIEDINTSEEDGDGGLYDTDSDHQVLQVFEDESETDQTAPVTKKKRNKKTHKSRRAREASVLDENADSEDENFIDDDDDTLGIPDEALHLIPLEFTRASTKPLKLHFKDAIEWLIHRRINPGFDKDNEVYITAWRKLSDEVTGLANSKFISSVWRPDFHKALKARPYIDQEELGPGSLATEFENCQACGRSGHPATWSIRPWGKPYDPKTLDEVDSDSEDEDEDEAEGGDRDASGNIIPSEDTKFSVGQTCNSNAETAHSLMHWKIGLRDWVEAHLEGEGYFEASQVLEREQMKAKARHKVADQIVQNWDEHGVIQGLFGDFQKNIESARNKDPTKVARGRRW